MSLKNFADAGSQSLNALTVITLETLRFLSSEHWISVSVLFNLSDVVLLRVSSFCRDCSFKGFFNCFSQCVLPYTSSP